MSKRLNQVSSVMNDITSPAGEALLDEPFPATGECIANLVAKASIPYSNRRLANELAIEPSGILSYNLRFKVNQREHARTDGPTLNNQSRSRPELRHLNL